MNITLSDHAGSLQPEPTVEQARFNKLWQEVKKKQARNEKLKQEMDALMATYTAKVMPVELGIEEPLILLARRLVDFASRKSLADWQRGELQDWIAETLHEVSQYNAAEADAISNDYNQVIADYYDISVEELTGPPEIEDDIDAAVREAFESMTTDDETPIGQEDLFGLDDDEDRAFFEHEAAGPKKSADRKEQPINEKWIRNLFRRTARALHPDKEQDPAQRLHKQKLMTQLLDARDQQDIMTMMMLYNEHTEDGALSLESEEIENLCDLLEKQKDILDMDRVALIDESPMHYAVHDKLYAVSQKARDRKLKEHLDDVQASIKRKFKLVEYLRNLNNLKTVLEERYEDHRYI
ncbi:hypothetical protein [Alkalimarinus alittae]|uniref:J domain-containing protein n=1 Tax=Alkalimarinus alittae TaxID=2961619 RepID=A0ABY6N2D9_9ALTE|nr:hypothetical protein [Alkalimarinus alittae]UZE96261.1 hypothetical protein NKI27_00505 [Alkalimarinus alittae]